MKKEEYDRSTFWVGTEIEKTPAYGKRTLFVVGIQDPALLLDMVNESRSHIDRTKHITHIYFGANQTFPKLSINDVDRWRPWEQMIKACLDAGMWCTLDFDVSCVEGVIEGGFDEYPRFIASISVKIPYIRLLNYNATIKIDDKQFEGPNSGVWCHRVHDLQDKSVFTGWDQYSVDELIK